MPNKSTIAQTEDSCSQSSFDGDSVVISSFEVLIEKLKSNLSDDEILIFFSSMMKNDSHFRNCTTQLYQFTQEAMKPDEEVPKRVSASVPEAPIIVYDTKLVSVQDEFKDS